jgi:hypothetical protein
MQGEDRKTIRWKANSSRRARNHGKRQMTRGVGAAFDLEARYVNQTISMRSGGGGGGGGWVGAEERA